MFEQRGDFAWSEGCGGGGSGWWVGRHGEGEGQAGEEAGEGGQKTKVCRRQEWAGTTTAATL